MTHLTETDSTNRWLRDHADEFQEEYIGVVWTDHQTAGRGCGSNTWESEPRKNLLFSVLCHPRTVDATHQFLLLQAMALAVKDTLDPYLPQNEELKIKWPNDIYWHDRKLGGTLTECALSGQKMRWCIIGTGLNINQTIFSPALPNPVSIAQIKGCHLELEPLLQRITSCFRHRLGQLEQGETDCLQKQYAAALYRRHGYHPYRDDKSDFEAEIVSVAPDGTLTLRDRLQSLRNYKFKEVQFIIKEKNNGKIQSHSSQAVGRKPDGQAGLRHRP